MKNYRKPGYVKTYAHTAAVVSGEPIVVAGRILVATGTFAANKEGEYIRGGVVRLKKKAATAITTELAVYWDATAKEVTPTASGNTLLGVADQPAQASDTEVDVLINNTPYAFN